MIIKKETRDKLNACLNNKLVILLLISLLVLYIICLALALCCKGFSLKAFNLAFGCLFDAGHAANNAWSWLLFILAWLAGDGILLGIIWKQYTEWLDGYYRRPPNWVKNHIVVLGWDNGILTELLKIQEEENEKREENKDIYVITRQDASDLRKYLGNAGLKNVVVYKGDYDNENELRNNLKTSEAVQVFIAGELGEDAHDARVKLLYDKLKEKEWCGNSKTKIKANIHDFGLASKLEDNKDFENFHMKWANYLWNRLEKEGKIPKSENPFLHLYIAGFGAMGKSIVLTMPKAFLNAKNYRIIISGEDTKDKKVNEEFERYENQFNDGPKVEKPLIWSEFLKEIGKENTKQNFNNNICRIVVVAEKRSEKGMYCMMDIISKLNKKEDPYLTLALSQEIDGYVTHDKGKEPSLTIGEENVILFGMKKGCLNESENTSK